jgi:hypothetical protein
MPACKPSRSAQSGLARDTQRNRARSQAAPRRRLPSDLTIRLSISVAKSAHSAFVETFVRLAAPETPRESRMGGCASLSTGVRGPLRNVPGLATSWQLGAQVRTSVRRIHR